MLGLDTSAPLIRLAIVKQLGVGRRISHIAPHGYSFHAIPADR
jgi:hypothetical protein